MIRVTGALAASGLAAGCGIRPTGVVEAGNPPAPAAPATQNVLYFVKDGALVATTRTGLAGHALLAIDQLMAGPTADERRRGLTTELPPGISREPVADGDPALAIRQKDPDVRWSPLARAQVACTAERLPWIRRVQVVRAPGRVDSFTCTDTTQNP